MVRFWVKPSEIFDLHFQMGHEILRDLLGRRDDDFKVVTLKLTVSLAVKVGERSYLLVRSISILRLPNEKMVKFEANKIALNKSFWGLVN